MLFIVYRQLLWFIIALASSPVFYCLKDTLLNTLTNQVRGILKHKLELKSTILTLRIV